MSAFRLFIGCGHSFLQGLCDRTEKNAARIPVFIGKGDLVKWLPSIDLTDERIKGWLNERYIPTLSTDIVYIVPLSYILLLICDEHLRLNLSDVPRSDKCYHRE